MSSHSHETYTVGRSEVIYDELISGSIGHREVEVTCECGDLIFEGVMAISFADSFFEQIHNTHRLNEMHISITDLIAADETINGGLSVLSDSINALTTSVNELTTRVDALENPGP